LFGM